MNNNQLLWKMRFLSREKRIPFNVVIELIRSCNLRCRHCYHGTFDHKKLSLSQLERLFPSLAECGTLQLTLTGGEILQHSEIKEILKLASQYHFSIHLLTNLTLLTPGLADELARTNVSLVRTSLYFATARRHDEFVGLAGAHQKTFRALDLLKERHIPAHIQVVLMNDNLEELAALEEAAAARQVAIGGVFFLDPLNNGSESPLLLMPESDTLARAAAAGHSRLLKAMQFRECAAGGSCGAALDSCFVSAEYDLYPCISWPRAAGNLDSISFSELWHGQLMNAVARSHTGYSACRECPKRDCCSPCPALNLKYNGDSRRPYVGRCREADVYYTVLRRG